MTGSLRGWCPDLHRPMQSGDGLLVRIRPRAATLTAAQAIALDEACTAWGNGTIEITGRGNLQCRGLSVDGVEHFIDRVTSFGLAAPDPLVERRLRIIAAPLIGNDMRLARLEALLAGDAKLDALSEKFVFRIEGGAIGIADVKADIGIAPTEVTAGGLAFASDDPVADAIALAHAFLATGAARMGDLAASRVIGLLARPAHAVAQPAPAGTIGLFPFGCGVAPAFAQFEAGGLGRLARLGMGDGTLRITQARSVIVPGANAASLEAAGRIGMVVDAGDPRLRIRACIGAPSCASGDAPARAVAEKFLHLVPARGVLHLSGCDKRCAHPGPAAITFVGRNGALHRVESEAA